ncbi:MAG: O-antigen ligase family protein [bacterium]
MKKKIELAVKLLCYATFFVPLLVVSKSFIFPFIVPKIIVFRSLTVFMIGGYILLLIISWRTYRPKLSILNTVMALYLISFTISTIVGVDPYHSFWDNHERMLGLFTVIHYIAYYFVCSSLFKEWKDWKIALRILLIAGSCVTFIGFLQIFFPNLMLNMGRSRVSSTLGNAIYLGGYGMFLSFLAFLLVIKEEKRKFWFWAEIIMGLLAIIGMFVSGTRGSILGFLAGIGIGLICYLIVYRKKKKVRNTFLSIIFLALIALSMMYAFRQTNLVKNIPAVGRTLNTSLTDVMQTPRWIAWEIAVISWKEMPIFGWGPNNFFYAFNKYYNPKSLEHGYGETWFDNAHNIIVNTLTVQGIVGLLAYLAIFVGGIFALWSGYRKESLDKHMVVIGISFLIAHLIQNVTVFENPTSYLYFMLWLAFINSMATSPSVNDESVNQKYVPDRQIGMASILMTLIVVFLVIFIFNIQVARANMTTLKTLRNINEKPLQASMDIKESLSFSSPHIDDIRADIGRMVSQIVAEYYVKIGTERSIELIDQAIEGLKPSLTLHPLDIRNFLILSQLTQQKAFLSADKQKYLIESEVYLDQCLPLSPKRQQILYGLANLKIQLSKDDEAIKLVEQAISDDPIIGESYWRLAYNYMVLNKFDKAKEVIDLAYANNARITKNDESAIMEVLKTVNSLSASTSTTSSTINQ